MWAIKVLLNWGNNMQSRVFEYFRDLQMNKEDVEHSVFVKSQDFKKSQDTYTSNVKKYMLDGISYYVKSWNDEQSIAGVTTSQMYNHIGILTPPAYIICRNTKAKQTLSTVTQNVQSLKKLVVELASSSEQVKKFRHHYGERFFNYFQWQIFTDKHTQNTLLKFMTQGCIEQLIDIFLVDELRTDKDRHNSNYYLYKSPNSDKYEGVIPIDLELVDILQHKPCTSTEFNSYIWRKPYTTFTPTGVITNPKTYHERMCDLRELLNKGNIPNRNIETLKKALSFDYPQTIAQTCQNPHLQKYKNSTYEPYARLWEYNRETLGKDLDL